MAVYGQLARAGFRPEVIYDIGASNACWSSNVVGLFPTATYHLFEPLADTISRYREGLQWALAEHPLFNVHRMALGDTSGTVTIAIPQTRLAPLLWLWKTDVLSRKDHSAPAYVG